MGKHERESRIEKLLLSHVRNDNNTQSLRISMKTIMRKDFQMAK